MPMERLRQVRRVAHFAPRTAHIAAPWRPEPATRRVRQPWVQNT